MELSPPPPQKKLIREKKQQKKSVQTIHCDCDEQSVPWPTYTTETVPEKKKRLKIPTVFGFRIQATIQKTL